MTDEPPQTNPNINYAPVDLSSVPPINPPKTPWRTQVMKALPFLVFMVLLPVIVLGVRKNTVGPKSHAQASSARIYFADSSYTLPPNATASLWLDPGGSPLGFAQVEVNFDPTKVRLTSDTVISPTNPLTTVVIKTSKDAANASGKIILILGLPPGVTAPTTSFEYAQIPLAPVTTDSISTDLTVSQGLQLVDTSANVLSYTSQPATLVLYPTSSTSTQTFNPTADAYVNSSRNSTNYGTQSKLLVNNKPSIYITYLKLDLSALAGREIVSATLRLYVTKSSKSTQSIKSVDDTSWDETTIVYNNRPVLGQVLTTFSNSKTGSYQTIDLTSALSSKAGQIFTLGIDQTDSDRVDFYSKQAPSNKPELVVQYR